MKEFKEFSVGGNSGLQGKAAGSKHDFRPAGADGGLLELLELLVLLFICGLALHPPA